MVLDIKQKYSEAVIYGIDNNEDHLEKAIELGVIDIKATLEDLDKAELLLFQFLLMFN